MELEKMYQNLGGRSYIMDATGLTAQQLSDAKRIGVAPSTWYRQFKELGDAIGVEIPFSLFRFREAS